MKTIAAVTLFILLTSSCIVGGNSVRWREKKLQMDWSEQTIKVIISQSLDTDVVYNSVKFWNDAIGCRVFEVADYTSDYPFVVIRNSWNVFPPDVSASRIGRRLNRNVVFEISINSSHDNETQTSALEHELGHSLGLDDSMFAGSVMYNVRSPMIIADERPTRKIIMSGSMIEPASAKALHNRYCGRFN